MAKSLLRLTDPERIAINGRISKTVRWLGEHSVSKEGLMALYGSDNPLIALLDGDPGKEVTLIEMCALAVFDKAAKGDIRALEFIRDTVGEKPAMEVSVKEEGATNLGSLTAAQLRMLLELRGKADAIEAPASADPADGGGDGHPSAAEADPEKDDPFKAGGGEGS